LYNRYHFCTLNRYLRSIPDSCLHSRNSVKNFPSTYPICIATRKSVSFALSIPAMSLYSWLKLNYCRCYFCSSRQSKHLRKHWRLFAKGMDYGSCRKKCGGKDQRSIQETGERMCGSSYKFWTGVCQGGVELKARKMGLGFRVQCISRKRNKRCVTLWPCHLH
jgi:hypothetical protein